MTVPTEAWLHQENYPHDFKQYLNDTLDEFPNAQIDETTRIFLLDGLADMQQRNGDRPYHDVMHPFDVLRKAFRELEETARIAGFIPTQQDYKVLAIASIFHDNIMASDEEDISPELQSAEATYSLMLASGNYSERECERVRNLIWATEAEYDGKQVLQPMATVLAQDVCTPSLLYADIGDVLHRDWKYILVAAAKVAAEELYKLKKGQSMLRQGETPLDRVMGIFDKQDTFGKQRFTDYPEILRYHLGEEAAELIIQAKKDEWARQLIELTTYVTRLNKVRPALFNACKSIVKNRKNMPFHRMGAAFFDVALGKIEQLGSNEDE
ncbi:MAG: hypothetical protein JWO07_820 [Candidatus Saccharibacteria bacterium]|nr:hypothetical protein [Candidatus Saccharibacteria bacterium]